MIRTEERAWCKCDLCFEEKELPVATGGPVDYHDWTGPHFAPATSADSRAEDAGYRCFRLGPCAWLICRECEKALLDAVRPVIKERRKT